MRGGARACVGPCRKRRTNDALSGAGYATSSNSPARRKSVCRRDWDTAGALQSAQWWMTSANLFLPGVSLPGIALQRLEPIAPRSGPRMPKAKESVAGNKKLLSNPRQASHATMGRTGGAKPLRNRSFRAADVSPHQAPRVLSHRIPCRIALLLGCFTVLRPEPIGPG